MKEVCYFQPDRSCLHALCPFYKEHLYTPYPIHCARYAIFMKLADLLNITL